MVSHSLSPSLPTGRLGAGAQCEVVYIDSTIYLLSSVLSRKFQACSHTRGRAASRARVIRITHDGRGVKILTFVRRPPWSLTKVGPMFTLSFPPPLLHNGGDDDDGCITLTLPCSLRFAAVASLGASGAYFTCSSYSAHQTRAT